jgi:methyltransferase (TIGR00027 family)
VAGSTSRSATLVVLARTHLNWMRVIDDPLAQQMLRPGWARAASMLRIPGLGRLGQNRSFAYLGARTCFFDQFVADALDEGIHQVVVLGAGYDSRAWRFARPGVTFYEVDLPATQADKRIRAPVGGPTFVPADVTGPSLGASLTAAGFRPGEATAFTAEGLTMYLTEPQVTHLLGLISALSGPGSRLAVNFGVGFEQEGSRRGRFARRVMAAGGEELRFRLTPANAQEFVTKTGWAISEMLSGPQLRDKYLRGTKLAAVNVTTSGFAVAATASRRPLTGLPSSVLSQQLARELGPLPILWGCPVIDPSMGH